MTTDTVLTQDEVKRLKREVLIVWADDKGVTEFARATEQAVLQSPEVQRLREDAERLDILERDAGHFVFPIGKTWRTRPRPAQPGEMQEIAPKHCNLRDAIDAIAEKYK